jgi:hypothetical protein
LFGTDEADPGASNGFSDGRVFRCIPPEDGLEKKMALYELHFFCDECAETHRAPIVIGLADGPPQKESIGNVYGKAVPPQVAMFTNSDLQCPKTKKRVRQTDNDRLFLVPAEN